jgi:hypothetical protein
MKAPNSRDRNSVSVSLGHQKKKLAKLLVMVRSITLHSTLGYFWGLFYSCTFAGIVGIEMVDGHWPVKQRFFLLGEKSPKGDTAQIFARKSPFFLKSIRQTAPLFKERVATSMPTGYTFNAAG